MKQKQPLSFASLRSASQSRPTEESPPKVPVYIVTFSDMTTLLLTFFVMLVSLASVQDPINFNKGRGAFLQSLTNFGLGMIYGRRQSPQFSDEKIRYHIAEQEQFDGRTIDAKEEEIRRLFQQVSRNMTTMPSQIVAKSADLWLTGIRFGPGRAELDESAIKSITNLAGHLMQHRPGKTGDTIETFTGALYVLGLAPDQVGGEPAAESEQWMLSARRAQAVAQLLRQKLSSLSGPPIQSGAASEPGTTDWRIYCWGAGPGGNWVEHDSPISKNCHVLIGLLRAEADTSAR